MPRELLTLVFLGVLVLAPGSAAAQDDQPRARPRSLTLGAGVPYGMLGASLEYQLRESSWSLSAGFGVWPIDEDLATATVWNPGGSVKRYHGVGKHRLFGTLGVGVVEMRSRIVERAPRLYEIGDIDRRWGVSPGVGYHYRAHSGFTALLSANLAVAFDGDVGSIYPELGLGYAW